MKELLDYFEATLRRGRMILRASNSHAFHESLRIVLLSLTQVPGSCDSELVELTYMVSDLPDPMHRLRVEIKYSDSTKWYKRVESLLADWEAQYSDHEAYAVTWTEEREVVVEGNLLTGQLVDIPPNNVFFLQAMAQIEMWLTIKYPRWTAFSPRLLESLLNRVIAFIGEQNKSLMSASIFLPVTKT